MACGYRVRELGLRQACAGSFSLHKTTACKFSRFHSARNGTVGVSENDVFVSGLASPILRMLRTIARDANLAGVFPAFSPRNEAPFSVNYSQTSAYTFRCFGSW